MNKTKYFNKLQSDEKSKGVNVSAFDNYFGARISIFILGNGM